MNRRKTIRILLYTIALMVVVAAAIAYYLSNKPHRDVTDADIDFQISANALVTEYLQSPSTANQKYLADDGESKILAVTGKVANIDKDLNGQSVITLRDNTQKAGVSCTFTSSTNEQAEHISIGDVITVKGVIRSGAGYDEDLDLYEDVILEKCSINN
jgi:hypothetical protein